MSSVRDPGSGVAGKGRPPTVSRENVVEAAIRVAQRDGLSRLTMASLADELGVSTMAAYHHVKGKDHLRHLMMEELLTHVEIPDVSDGDWRRRAFLLQSRVRLAVAGVPGLREVVHDRGASEQTMRLTSAILSMFDEGGLDRRQAELALGVVVTFVTGVIDLDEARYHAGLNRNRANRPSESDPTADEIFEFGLTAILDGVERSNSHS